MFIYPYGGENNVKKWDGKKDSTERYAPKPHLQPVQNILNESGGPWNKKDKASLNSAVGRGWSTIPALFILVDGILGIYT